MEGGEGRVERCSRTAVLAHDGRELRSRHQVPLPLPLALPLPHALPLTLPRPVSVTAPSAQALDGDAGNEPGKRSEIVLVACDD